MIRDTLFISHATPDDNEFAIWLASRLEMLGYKTWIDKNCLLGGERMWQEIQNILENNTVKVLLVYSKNVRDYNNQVKSGIYDEISFAKSVSKNNSLVDFIIPLHIDNSSYSEIIGFDGVKQIPFCDSWASGLKELLKKLEQQNIIKQEQIFKSSIASWYENEYLDCCKITNKEEKYYSSWWKICQLPNFFYIHTFKNRWQADLAKRQFADIPIGQIANHITTFERDLRFKSNDGMFEHNIQPDRTLSFTIDDIYNRVSPDDFPTNNDLLIHFKHLLNQTFFMLMKSKQLRHYRFSGKTAFYSGKYKKFNFVNFVYPDTEIKKSKKLGGNYYVHFWNYAISSKAMVSPIVGFSIASHLIFTEDGTKPIDDGKLQSSHRRSKARRFFNSDWRDLLLAYIQNLKDEDNEIKIKVSRDDTFMKFSLWPEMYSTDFGYIDPIPDGKDTFVGEENDEE